MHIVAPIHDRNDRALAASGRPGRARADALRALAARIQRSVVCAARRDNADFVALRNQLHGLANGLAETETETETEA